MNAKLILKNSKGITLIALIITIIVILILATVSIANIHNKDKGVVKQATNSKQITDESMAIEQIQVELLGSYDKRGKRNYANLKSNLEELGITGIYDEEIYPIYFKYEGYNLKIDKDWKVSKNNGEIVYQAKNLTFNGTSDYIDTGIRLFNEENFDKDFQIRITISEFGDITDQDTIINSKFENSSQSYPGFVLRYLTGEFVPDIALDIRGGTKRHVTRFLKSDIRNKTLTILRINGEIYYQDENGTYWFLDTETISKFDTPVTIGCSLDSNGEPFRFFNGKISDIQIIFYDDDLDIDVEKPTPVYVKLYGDTLVFSSTNVTLANKTLTQDYGDVSFENWNWDYSTYKNNYWYKKRTSIKYVEILDEIRPIYMNYWFADLYKIEGINNINNINTKNVVSIVGGFRGCTGLQSLDISSFNTECLSHSISSMFSGDTNLQELKLCTFKNRALISYEAVFSNCSKINTEFTFWGQPHMCGDIFYNAATQNGSGITVNYTTISENMVDGMIATKSNNSNVQKGIKVD